MTDTTNTKRALFGEPVIIGTGSLEVTHDEVSELLARLQDIAPAAIEGREPCDANDFENRLALVRLGMATSLYYALRTKHASSAAHSLRVAIICSAWAERSGLETKLRDQIEVAALLHDLGKIGIPDRILRKPSRLSVEEQLLMDASPEMACEILRGCTDDQDLLSIVRYANAWFKSRRTEESPRGDALPLGSRMLAIANAFDSMTTDHVYRTAFSRERALQELVQGSGTQFDPELVNDFTRMLESSPELMQGSVVNRWLQGLRDTDPQGLVNAAENRPQRGQTHKVRRETRFHNRLLTDLKDGVAFTNAQGTITHWNSTMVRLTGVPASAIVGKTWDARALNLRSKDPQTKFECPLQMCFDSSAPVSRSAVVGSKQDPTPVHVQVSPVSSEEPGLLGAVVILHDNSVRESLEDQLETLHQKTTMDALTGVANRAFFDESLARMTEETAAGGPTFSLVICDIDFFKRVNDVHGHPAGDEALVGFANVLRNHSRDGDIVARYGGEEFLLLAPNCDNATAAKRAEAIRQALEQTPLPSLGGESVTASFGVTEFQAGDTCETVLSRSDRALLKAKDNGRNRVVQLGTGVKAEKPKTEEAKRGWFSWFDSGESAEHAVDIITPVPANLAIEKLKGFIADHDAEIIKVCESQVSLKINALCENGGRRRADLHLALKVQLTLSEARPDELEAVGRSGSGQTKVHVCMTPMRSRDRRNREFQGCVDRVSSSLRSYLMGEILDVSGE